LAIGFAVLLLLRFGSIHRQHVIARWPALALGAAALAMLWRGGVEPALILAMLAMAAWFVSPRLQSRAPAPETPRPAEAQARAILGVGLAATPDEIRAAYRRKIAEAHPDRGGSHDQAARLTAARDTLLKARR
jgi:DnaJ family protein C protein 19